MVDITTDAIKGIAQLLGAQIWDEINLAWGFQDQLEKLKAKFLHTQAFLNDVGNTKHQQKSEYIELWLHKYKDVVYDVSEVMDDYEYEILRRKVELGSKKKLGKFFRCNANNPIVFRFRMAHKVQKVLFKFDELSKEAIEIGLQMKLAKEATSSFLQDDSESLRLQDIRKHASVSPEFVGREKDMRKLLDEILHNPDNQNCHQPKLIAIVGLGGLGKTTLSRCLYKHEEIEANFANRKAWVCVSDDFKVERLCKEIQESFLKNGCNIEELKMKKFLLVLDDVWNDVHELWDTLKIKLVEELGSVTGSVILISTRSNYVATAAIATYTHKLEGLSNYESWDLFKKIASTRNCASILPYSFENVGRRIVEKCKGVPLAIKTIGAILVAKKNLSDWELIEGSQTWNLEQSGYLLPSLLLSYNHLPSLSVKQCFAYCAIFPKDRLLYKDRLIALWASQGFLHDGEILSMEESGERILNILLNNSFLQEEGHGYVTGEIICYKMHDLVHDLAFHVLQRDLFICNEKTPQPNVDLNYRHLVYKFIKENKQHIVDENINMQKVWTINICEGNELPIRKISKHARYLRTLIIDESWIKEVPTRIGELKHLRYLDMQTLLLPDSFCTLYQLQTLILYCNYLPRGLHKLVNLRLIKVSCLDCRWLPIVEKLPNLRVLECRKELLSSNDDDGDEYYDVHFGESWGNRKIIDGYTTPTEIFPALTHLVIQNFKKLKNLSSSATLNFKSLHHLQIENACGCEPLGIIKNHSCANITSLSLNMTNMTSLPEDLPNCTKLKIFHLTFCRSLVSLPIGMKSLTSLQEVKIENCETLTCIPDDMFEGLYALRNLEINCCDKLESIPSSLAKCISLEVVDIFHCNSLKGLIPDLRNSKGLVELYFNARNCSSSVIEWIPHLPRLQKLYASSTNIPKEEEEDETKQDLRNPSLLNNSLEELSLSFKFEKARTLPQELLQLNLPNLRLLKLSECEELEELPVQWIGTLSSLQQLDLTNCPKLKSLPSMEHIPILQLLKIFRCPVLEERILAKDDTPGVHSKQLYKFEMAERLCPCLPFLTQTSLPQSEWDKISHVPEIRIYQERGYKSARDLRND